MKIKLLTKPEYEKKCLDKLHQYDLEVVKLAEDADYIISYMYPKKIDSCLLAIPKIGCLNFHPAPLPEYAGLMMATWAILNNESKWGVTCHWMDEQFDTGDIVRIDTIHLNVKHFDAESLSYVVESELFELYCLVLIDISKGKKLERVRQDLSKRKYYSRKMFEKNRELKCGDDFYVKIRAYSHSNYKGAYFKLNGKKYYPLTEKQIDTLQQTVD